MDGYCKKCVSKSKDNKSAFAIKIKGLVFMDTVNHKNVFHRSHALGFIFY